MIFCQQLPSPGISCDADDCAIWHSSPYAEFSAGRIQLALDSVQHWASLWGFKFSVPKCIGVVFTRRNVPDLQLTLPRPADTISKFSQIFGSAF